MLTLLKNIKCYSPCYIGKKDILIAGDKIFKILPINLLENNKFIDVISCNGLMAFPGLIDQHVHIVGGGGEQGFLSRIPEIDSSSILMAGVSTLVGLLGVDNCTKNLDYLYAKSKSLELQGITTFIYSGSYSLPAVNFTGNIARDLVLIDKVIGSGEIAISDHRSSQPALQDLLKIASDTHRGGLIGGKPGILHLHLGDGKSGLSPLLEILDKSELPIEMFVPTHVNRNKELFEQAILYCKSGGNIDLTSGEKIGVPVPDAIQRLVEENVDFTKVTVSSDANASIPDGGISLIQSLYDDLKTCIVDKKIPPEVVFRYFTENVARALKLYSKKGVLMEGSDADILVTDQSYNVRKLFCMGKLLVDDGRAIKTKI